MLKMIPLAQIQQGANPRKERDKDEDKALRASIEAHGLLQPILVHFVPEADAYEVIAGNRRFEAAKALGWTEIACNEVNPVENTIELALVENVIRENMSEVDQFEAFAKMVADNMTPLDIASRFSIDIARVHRILALGSLHPDCLAAWRKDKIDFEYAQALTMAAPERQPKLMKEFKTTWQLREALKSKLLSMETARFTREEYEAAGGAFTKDLFSQSWDDGERSYSAKEYVDPEIFWTLQNAWIEKEKDRLAKDGWGTVETVHAKNGMHQQVWKFTDRPTKAKKAARCAFLAVGNNGEVIVHINCAANKADYERQLKAEQKTKAKKTDKVDSDHVEPESADPVPEMPTLSGATTRHLSLMASAELVRTFGSDLTTKSAIAAWIALMLANDQRLHPELGDLGSGMQDRFEHPFNVQMEELQKLCGKWDGRGFYLKRRHQAKAIYGELITRTVPELTLLFGALLGLVLHWNNDGRPHPFAAALGEQMQLDPLANYPLGAEFWARTTKAYMLEVASKVACVGWAQGNVAKNSAKDAAVMMGALFTKPTEMAKKIKDGNYTGSQDLTAKEIADRIFKWRPEGFGPMVYDSNEDNDFDLDDDIMSDDEFEDEEQQEEAA
jgi:ParB/RepB/Spo0J family partition protein